MTGTTTSVAPDWIRGLSATGIGRNTLFITTMAKVMTVLPRPISSHRNPERTGFGVSSRMPSQIETPNERPPSLNEVKTDSSWPLFSMSSMNCTDCFWKAYSSTLRLSSGMSAAGRLVSDTAEATTSPMLTLP